MIPPPFSHRGLVLLAMNWMAWFLESTYTELSAIPNLAPCEKRQRGVTHALSMFQDLSLWVRTLSVQPGSLAIDGNMLDPAGVVQMWVSEVGSQFYAMPWQQELDCKGDTTANALSIDLFTMATNLQKSWPWFVVYAAIVAMDRVNSSAPADTRACYNDEDVVLTLLKQLRTPQPLMVEVGVDSGSLSESMLRHVPRLRVIGVDPYPDVYGGVPSVQRVDKMGSRHLYNIALSKYEQFSERAELQRLTSVIAAGNWKSQPIDIVYIDAEHDFDSCRADIMAWYPLVRPGGIIAGDDYQSAYGVPWAVHDQLPLGVTLNLAPHGVWWWKKP